MYIEAWLFWVIVVVLCAIFGTIIGSINIQLNKLEKKQEYETKALLSQIQKSRKIIKHYHPKCDDLNDL